jgi:hypothetical protein
MGAGLMEWLRWYHGTTTDPKWRMIAKRTGQPVAVVVAVWAHMMETAGQATERGTLDGWRDDVTAALLDMEEADVRSIREAMRGLTIDGETLPAWAKRQPKREDGSAERARRWRESKKEERTQPNATERAGTPEERRVEKRTDLKETVSNETGADAPQDEYTDPAYRADVAGHVRSWWPRGKEPKPGAMKTELDVARNLAKRAGRRLAVEAIRCAPDVVPGIQSLKVFVADGTGPQRWELALQRARDQAEREVGALDLPLLRAIGGGP